MKNKLSLLIVMSLVLVFSCKNDDEGIFTEVKSSIEIKIPVSTVLNDNSKSAQNSTKIDYSFSGESVYTASSLTSGTSQVKELQSVRPDKESFIQIPGIIEGGQISSLRLIWGFKSTDNEEFTFQEPIDLLTLESTVKQGNFIVNLKESLNPLIDKLNKAPGSSIKLTVSGSSDFNISGMADVNIPVIIETKSYSPRFELY